MLPPFGMCPIESVWSCQSSDEIGQHSLHSFRTTDRSPSKVFFFFVEPSRRRSHVRQLRQNFFFGCKLTCPWFTLHNVTSPPHTHTSLLKGPLFYITSSYCSNIYEILFAEAFGSLTESCHKLLSMVRDRWAEVGQLCSIGN